jgi:hypothetical protein
MMPGYIGHNVAERKELEASKAFSERLFTKGETIEISLSSAELQEFCDRWLVRYHNRPHEGLGGLSPVQKAASGSRLNASTTHAYWMSCWPSASSARC